MVVTVPLGAQATPTRRQTALASSADLRSRLPARGFSTRWYQPLKIGKVGFLGKSIPPIAQSLRASAKAAPLLGRCDEDQHEVSS